MTLWIAICGSPFINRLAADLAIWETSASGKSSVESTWYHIKQAYPGVPQLESVLIDSCVILFLYISCSCVAYPFLFELGFDNVQDIQVDNC